MEKRMETPGGVIVYDLQRRAVKNINIRISGDGQVRVSAPKRCALKMIEQFILQKSTWITDSQRQANVRRDSAGVPQKMRDGEVVYLLGQPHHLRFTLDRTVPHVDGGDLVVPTGGDTDDARWAGYRRAVDVLCKTYFAALNAKIAPLFAGQDVPAAEMTARRMRARWGSCYINTGKITLNKCLLHLPESCGLHVLTHEYCHFLHAGHGRDFKDLLRQMDPTNGAGGTELKKYNPAHYFPKQEEEQMNDEMYYGGYNAPWWAKIGRSSELTSKLNSMDPADIRGREALLEELFCEIGTNSVIEPPFYCEDGKNTRIGHTFYANYACCILDSVEVTIGDRVLLGPRVTICTAEHPIHPDARFQNGEVQLTARPVVIGDNVWIGGHTLIAPGVTIGEGAVIGAGSVVTKDVPPRTVAAGVPCRIIREITDEDYRRDMEAIKGMKWED